MKVFPIRKMVLASLLAALTTVCAWIQIPVLDIAFTMQTFAVFMTLGILGGRWGTVSIAIYLAMGAVGLPVFAGFQGGVGVLLGVTGGYIWGFLLSGLVYWSLERLCKPAAMTVALLVCYLCGTLWFSVYAGSGVGLAAAAAKCVVPYLLPDAVKLVLALRLSARITRQVRF